MAAAMGVEERVATLRSTAEECVGGEDELRTLLHGNPSPIFFHSFQSSVSGRVDIAQVFFALFLFIKSGGQIRLI
jgi:hypothetical protein